MNRRRGYFTTDTLVGLGIIAVVTGLLLRTVHQERLAEASLADSRAAIHLAEHAMLNLQHHQPLPALPPQSRLKMSKTLGPAAPAGLIWIDIDAAVSGHHQSLKGIVSESTVSGVLQ